MKKVIIIGCPGSGKTTFAERLCKATELPLYYLDAIWHKADKTHITREEFDLRLSEILATPEWIIDGNYNRTLELRLRRCDTVFLFDLPTDLCMRGAIERIGRVRSDLPFTEKELSPELEQAILDFPRSSLPRIYELLDRYKEGKQITVFKSREAAEAYLGDMLLPSV